MLEERRCVVCGRSEEYTTLVAHHTYRRQNDDETVWVCTEPHPYRGLSCHQVAHLQIEDAKDLGIYKPFGNINK